MRYFLSLTLAAATIFIVSCGKKGPDKTGKSDTSQVTLPDTTTLVVEDTLPKMEVVIAPPVGDYYIISRDSMKQVKDSFSKEEIALIAAINRVDANIFLRPDSLVIPKDLSHPFNYYFPFPQQLPALQSINKILIFSYPTETFAAYKNGVLELTGPTSMGKSKTRTPRGLFFTNWKSKEAISTSNEEWILKWNFNVSNRMGVGFHQYQLPGYPASHSCMRMREQDAKFLYSWADQWVLQDANTVNIQGTPVIIYGMYPFGERRPWRNLAENPQYLAVSPEQIDSLITPHMDKILQNQQKRMVYEAAKDTTSIRLASR